MLQYVALLSDRLGNNSPSALSQILVDLSHDDIFAESSVGIEFSFIPRGNIATHNPLGCISSQKDH